MSLSEWVTAGVALAALVLGVVNFIVERNRAEDATVRERERDAFEQRTTEEAVEIQRSLFEIEERRHEWEREQRAAEAVASLRADETARTAAMKVRFAYRDSARTWARILATNYGPADASDVALDVYARQDGKTVEVEPVGGTDYRTADRLQPNESVHVGVAFTFGSPQPEDLRYRLSWVDGRGEQTDEGQVPIE
ncbi:MAG: hypothetical protein GWP04_08325 [Gammaproteobacteria bacterium]|nr:hypothetical protein [Gammaproteobacteria bacterium]